MQTETKVPPKKVSTDQKKKCSRRTTTTTTSSSSSTSSCLDSSTPPSTHWCCCSSSSSRRWGTGCGGLRGRAGSSAGRPAEDRSAGGTAGGRTNAHPNTQSHINNDDNTAVRSVILPALSVIPGFTAVFQLDWRRKKLRDKSSESRVSPLDTPTHC